MAARIVKWCKGQVGELGVPVCLCCVVGAVVLSPVPFPGTSLAPFIIAKRIKRWRRK